jgi:predicted XRE-type DNA-binding protein
MNAESSETNYAHLINGCDPKIELTPQEAARYWAKVDKASSPRGCWIWTGCIHPIKGYGAFRFRGRNHAAHRITYRHFKGDIPDALLVCHTCDVRNCVNPDHLWLGTNKANMRDMVDKGRAADGSQVPNGERCYAAKLKESDVIEIRRLYSAGGITQKAIAQKFNVQQMQISRIMKGTRWRHLLISPIDRMDTKITDEQTIEIYQLYLTGTVSQATLADHYGVTQTLISRIMRGIVRPHLKLQPIKSPALRGRRTDKKTLPEIV